MPSTAIVAHDVSVVMRRTFQAPLADVWTAWTDAEALMQWWGGHGFRTTADIDPRPGGRFLLTVQGADGEVYPIQGEYVEITDRKSLSMEMHLDDHPANWHDYLALQFTRAGGDEDTLPSLTVVTTATFQSLGIAETRLTVEQTYATQAEREAFDAMGNADSWRQSFEKLDRYLVSMAP